jgi:hypothetical protein
MKKEFIGFYNPTEIEISEAWSNGTFAFDANTLLNIYRYTELTRKDFLSALKTIKDKLFLPHQTALEFHSNRIGVIEGIGFSYLNLYKLFEVNFEKNLEPQINQFKKHPSIIIDNINKLHSEFLKKVSTELEKQKKNHPDFKTKDEVLEQLTELFENVIGKEFSKEELTKIFIEGKDRYAESTPPGFKDLENKRKKGDRHVYGDLIIWKELINFSKKGKKPLIFVTDDRKEDWWTIENGKTIRPREELIKEFFDLTGIRILIYNAENFLQFAKEKKLVPQLKDKTIKEVKDVRISDENIYTVKDILNSNSYQINKPISISDLLGSQSYQVNSGININDILGNQSYQISKPISVSDLLGTQSYQLNSGINIDDILKNHTYQINKPISISDILGAHLNQSSIYPSTSDSKIYEERKTKTEENDNDKK